MILEAIQKATNNFTKGFGASTLLGWRQVYDKEGRSLRADPNYKTGTINIEGEKYCFIRKGWIVRLWDKPYHPYTAFNKDFIEEMDLKPEYVLEYETNHSRG